MKIELEVSEDNEGTDSPYWLILNPWQNMRANVHELAGQITGPFFSRKVAEDFLAATRYNFHPKAVVYCLSGCYTTQYRNAIRKAEKETGRRIGDKVKPASGLSSEIENPTDAEIEASK